MDLQPCHNFIHYHDNKDFMNGLYVDSIRKSFGNRQILTDVYLHCQKGEIIGLLGRNGTGKSTLLKIIFGSLQAENKFVRVDDKVINTIYDNKGLINFLPQDDFLPSHSQIRRLISVFCDKKHAGLLYEKSHLKPLMSLKKSALSGGERRILSLYMLLYSSAPFVLIDEPFNGLAPLQIEEIKSMMCETSKNKGLIITDHDYRNIMDISTRILLLHDGGIKEISDKGDLEFLGYLPKK